MSSIFDNLAKEFDEAVVALQKQVERQVVKSLGAETIISRKSKKKALEKKVDALVQEFSNDENQQFEKLSKSFKGHGGKKAQEVMKSQTQITKSLLSTEKNRQAIENSNVVLPQGLKRP